MVDTAQYTHSATQLSTHTSARREYTTSTELCIKVAETMEDARRGLKEGLLLSPKVTECMRASIEAITDV